MYPAEAEAEVIVIGAGISGLSSSYYLSKNNIDHVIFEKASAVGGIWSAQAWPGIRCDTDIIKYSFSFNPYLCATSLVSGECISDYLKETARAFDIESKIIFGTLVLKAVFITAEGRWHVHTNKGCYKAKFIVNANGYFADEPYIPQFPGVDKFCGKVAHLAHLGQNVDLGDKRVVLVGSGASAISAAPELCARSKAMTLLQRSPSYVFEDKNHVGMFVKAAWSLYTRGIWLPLKLVTYMIQLKDDMIFVGFRMFPTLAKLFFRHHWVTALGKRAYEEHFRPTYNPWQQRIPVAVGLKEILQNEKLKMVTGHIREFRESGIVLTDGRTIDADLCILATGYNLKFFKFDVVIDEHAVDTRGINFFRGMMMGGIPNYFQPFGAPHTSFTRRIEVMSKLVAKIICYMSEHQMDSVSIDRKDVEKQPKITPNYVMRELANLPAIYGSLELPSIDNIAFLFFRRRHYRFSRAARAPASG